MMVALHLRKKEESSVKIAIGQITLRQTLLYRSDCITYYQNTTQLVNFLLRCNDFPIQLTVLVLRLN